MADKKEIFADGIGQIHFTGGMVRFDFMTLQPDEEGKKPAPQSNIRIIRDGIVVYTGKLASLKRFKDDVKEVVSGQDCGLNIENYNDIKVGDIVEAYEVIEIKRKL